MNEGQGGETRKRMHLVAGLSGEDAAHSTHLFIYSLFFHSLAAINSQFAKFVNSNVRIYVPLRRRVPSYTPRKKEYMKYLQFSQIKRGTSNPSIITRGKIFTNK